MSLQGTLETIPLPDVLALLAATKKTGELRITGARGEGHLWLETGRVIAADVPRAATPVDAVFELLRLSAGSFTFGAGAPSGAPCEPIAVDVLLVEAQQRLRAWQAIEAVVPSMACTLRLTPELAHDSVTVSRQQWKELVAVAASGDVNGAMKTLALGEFDACRTIKELVDAGLVQVGKVPAPPAQATPTQPAPPAKEPAPPAQTRPAAETRAAAEQPRPAPPAEPVPAARVRRPPPTVGAVPARPASNGPADPIRHAPMPVRAPAGPSTPSTAAPAAAANGGRSAAPRRAADPARDREEAEELVQQMALLGTSQANAKAHPAAGDTTPAADHNVDGNAGHGADAEAKEKDGQPGRVKAVRVDEGNAEGNADEPINRGMLLKFLSSVRP